jgi:23S rRNA pseudouridine1911/1915/1917 synthase
MTEGPHAAPSTRHLHESVASSEAGTRLDVWLGIRLPDLSRTRIKALVEAGHVLVDGRRAKASHRLKLAEQVEVRVPPPPSEELTPEPVPLAVVFEDDHVLVVDKPAGMVTHPGAGRSSGTLAAAALAHTPTMAGVGGPRRPGIVHRLDKGTSGLIVLAKTAAAYDGLTAQLASRSVTRRYLCIAHGTIKASSGVIDKPIGRDEHSRVRMAVAREGRGKRAVTRFRVLETFRGFTFLECRLETGRTHQIRVHLASMGHPLMGDQTYGGRVDRRASVRMAEDLIESLDGVALHAAELVFTHPVTGERLTLVSPLPHRIEGILSHLRRTSG